MLLSCVHCKTMCFIWILFRHLAKQCCWVMLILWGVYCRQSYYTHKTLYTMCNACAWPKKIMLEELCKQIQHCCATLRWTQTKEMLGMVDLKVWPASNFKFAQQLPTTCNSDGSCWWGLISWQYYYLSNEGVQSWFLEQMHEQFSQHPSKRNLKNYFHLSEKRTKQNQAVEYLTRHTNHLKLHIHIPPKQTARRPMGSVSQEGNHA